MTKTTKEYQKNNQKIRQIESSQGHKSNELSFVHITLERISMDNNENNTILNETIGCNKQSDIVLYVLNEDKAIVSESTNNIEERSLLNEARIEGFKTIEQAEAFLRRENHTLKNPMDERSITSRVNILREEIEAAQKKQANDKLSTENINCIEVPKGSRLVIECIEKLIKENINNYTKEEINKVIITDIAEHFELTNKEVSVVKQSFKAMVKNIDLSREINVKKESEVESTEVDPQDIDFDEHNIDPELIEKAARVADRILGCGAKNPNIKANF